MQLTTEILTDYLLKDHNIQSSELTETTPLFSSGLLDSFSMVEIVTFVEKAAGIKIRAVDLTLDNFDSIDHILRFIESIRK